jgi:DNA-binding SARP family transcriptional activator/Tfp pilus assembly protein PilF
MAMLCAHLFGGLAVSWDGTPLPAIAGKAPRSLFAYLLTYRDRPHTRDLLAGTFWPDLPDDVARRRLSQALWQVRKALDPHPVLLAERDTVQIDPELPLRLDIEEFARHRAECLGEDPAGEPEVLGHCESCLEHYRGDFLAGYYDDWLFPERERLRDQFLGVLERLVAGYKRLGDDAAALAHARRLASEDPLREEAHHEVMRLCHLLGRDAEALQQYETCRHVLAEELGVDPSAETTALAQEIVEHGDHVAQLVLPQAPPTPAAFVLDSAEGLELPLVGREAERAELLAHVEALFQGLGGAVLLEGEAGVGKTRLLRAIADDAVWRGAEVLWGKTHELEASVPYGPLVEALSGEISSLRASQLHQVVEEIWLQVLIELLQPLGAALPHLRPPPALEPAQERDRLVNALTRLLAGWAQIVPLLLIIEDLHWARDDSLDLLARLVPLLGGSGVLVVGSYRGEEARARPETWQKLETLDRVSVRQRLVLKRLNAAASGELVRRSLGLGSPAPLFESRLFQETEGNPLFLLETLRALHGEGLLVRDKDGQWSTPWDERTSDYAELPLPPAVEQIIARRLDLLAPPLKQTVHMAAVLGERFGFELLRAASGQDASELLSALRALVQRRFLDETEQDYRFHHDKIRQVAYASIGLPERSRLHRRAGQTLESLQPARVAALAHHWTEAQVWDKAAACHYRAGDRARAVYANADALAHYTQALEVLARLPGPVDPLREFELRRARERVYDLQGAREEQTQELAALARLAEILADDRQRAEVALRQARQAGMVSDFPLAISAAGRAVKLARMAGDVKTEAESHLEWAWALLLRGEHRSATTQLEEVLALAQRARLRRLEAEALHGLGSVCLIEAEYAQARAYFDQVLSICREVDMRPREAGTLASLGWIATAQGDHLASKSCGQKAMRIHQEIGDQAGAANVMENLSHVFLAEGDFATARNHLEEALAIQRVIQDQWRLGNTLRCVGTIIHQLGDYAQARDYYQQALDLISGVGMAFVEGQALAYMSLLSHHEGDDLAAREHSERGLAIAREIDDRLGEGWLLDTLGHALAGLGELDQAAEAYRQSLVLRQELDQLHLAAESRAGLARVALQQGNAGAAMEQVEEILRIEKARGVGGATEPFRIWLTCYRVLDACQDPRAGEVLTIAHERLQEQRSNIHNEDLERTFLENVDAHREIITAYEAGQALRQMTVRLARAGAPTGRPLRDDEYVTITWTAAAPEDEAIADGPKRRQARIRRLLQEAADQDGAPTVSDLAEALAVSEPTVRRDLAALRRSGQPVQTRGSRGG